MTLFTEALIVEIMSLLTLQMWRIVSSLCSQELKELMKEVFNDFLYIYLPICASFEFFYLQSCIYYLLITIKYTKNSMFQWFHKPKLKIFIPRWLHEYLEWILILLFNWAQKYNFFSIAFVRLNRFKFEGSLTLALKLEPI